MWKAWEDNLSDEEMIEEVREIADGREKLETAKSLLAKGFATKQSRGQHKQQLLMFTQRVQRQPDLRFPMTEAEGSP